MTRHHNKQDCKCCNVDWPADGNNADNYLNDYWREEPLYDPPLQTWDNPYLQTYVTCIGMHNYMIVESDVLDDKLQEYFAIAMCRRCGHLAKVRIGPINNKLEDLELLNPLTPQPTEEESTSHGD